MIVRSPEKPALALNAMLLPLFLTGCGRSPSVNVLGSYFPSWLACAVFGILIATILGFLLRHWELEERIQKLPLFYCSVALIVACIVWLTLFE